LALQLGILPIPGKTELTVGVERIADELLSVARRIYSLERDGLELQKIIAQLRYG
jgi:hypothetical protein